MPNLTGFSLFEIGQQPRDDPAQHDVNQHRQNPRGHGGDKNFKQDTHPLDNGNVDNRLILLIQLCRSICFIMLSAQLGYALRLKNKRGSLSSVCRGKVYSSQST